MNAPRQTPAIPARPARESPAGTAYAALANGLLAKIAELGAASAQDRDPEALHQFRVALRRLRLVLKGLRRRCDDGPARRALERAESDTRTLARRAGAVRDCDVARELVLQSGAGTEDRSVALRYIAQARDAAFATLRPALRDATLANFAARESEAVAGGAAELLAHGVPARDALRADFDRELRRLRRALGAPLRGAEAFHALRRQARRVRDLADLYAPWLRRRQHEWRTELRTVQAILGELNDVENVCALLPLDDRAAAPARQTFGARRRELLAEVAAPLALLAIDLRLGG